MSAAIFYFREGETYLVGGDIPWLVPINVVEAGIVQTGFEQLSPIMDREDEGVPFQVPPPGFASWDAMGIHEDWNYWGKVRRVSVSRWFELPREVSWILAESAVAAPGWDAGGMPAHAPPTPPTEGFLGEKPHPLVDPNAVTAVSGGVFSGGLLLLARLLK